MEVNAELWSSRQRRGQKVDERVRVAKKERETEKWRAAGYKCFRYQLGLAANPAYPSIPQCGDINYEILR